MTREELIQHMTKGWHADPQACAVDMLHLCESVVRSWERVLVFSTLKSCPSCNGVTAQPGLVREYFMCTNEWHNVKAALDTAMQPLLVPHK